MASQVPTKTSHNCVPQYRSYFSSESDIESRVQAPQKLCRPRRPCPSTGHTKFPKHRKSVANGGIEQQSRGQVHLRENIDNDEKPWRSNPRPSALHLIYALQHNQQKGIRSQSRSDRSRHWKRNPTGQDQRPMVANSEAPHPRTADSR